MKYTYEIEQDTFRDSPREWDNLGAMVCMHSRYTLGDEQPTAVGNWLSEMLYDLGIERLDKNGYTTESWDDFIYDLENDDDEAIGKAQNLIQDKCFILPLFLRDHSGITMRTVPFSCPWDSGQVGFIYVTKDAVRKEWGVKRISAKLRQTVIDNLIGEVKMYDQYLTGDVWFFSIKDRFEDVVDSYGGFFGYDHCEEEAQSMAKWHESRHEEECFERVR